MNLQELLYSPCLTLKEIMYLLTLDNAEDIEKLRKRAYQVMTEKSGETVYLRGLIEFSNYCINDCHYCGIRAGNHNIKRYTLLKQQIINQAILIAKRAYGSLVLQSGERQDKEFIDFVYDVICSIKKATVSEKMPEGISVTLSIGEQSKQDYERLFEAGAHRYLLRIETSSRALFENIHTPEQSFEKRLNCIKNLQAAGYQTGTGVMIGLPGQTVYDLAKDIIFFRNLDIDMIGMGPYIPHSQTPLGISAQNDINRNELLAMSLKMIAVTRIILKDVNIASTTALQVLDEQGRELGLSYGANVVMPQFSPSETRRDYTLYEGKPYIDEKELEYGKSIEEHILNTGRPIGYNVSGDPMHFLKKRRIKSI